MQSPMMIWELIHRLVEMLNRTFENVSELDIMINSGLVRIADRMFSLRNYRAIHDGADIANHISAKVAHCAMRACAVMMLSTRRPF